MANRMWRAATGLALVVLALAGPGLAQDQRMITVDEAPLWNAVGRLNIAGNRYCTGTLISPDEVITAAHCLFHPITGHPTDPAEVRFVAGFRRDSYAALARATAIAIVSFRPSPGVRADPRLIAFDVALIKLDQPIPRSVVVPLEVVDWPADLTAVDIVGYGQDRPLIASIRQGCRFLADDVGAKLFDCATVPGLSGAPAVLTGSQDLLAVVTTSVGTMVKGEATLVVPVAPLLATLRARLAG